MKGGIKMSKCDICKKNFESFQMSSSKVCNICAYFRNTNKSLKKTYKKFREAKTL